MANNILFSQEGEVGFDPQPKRNALLPASRAGRSNKQRENGKKRSISSGPAADMNDKSRPISTRRRTQVACDRCRRRKIKCSGDAGDGQSCSNCRSSGTPNCEFLRPNCEFLQVNSSKVNCPILHNKPSFNGWPYPTVNPMLASSSGPGLYPHTSKAAMLSANSPGLRQPTGYDLGSSNHQPALARQPFGFDQNMPYENDYTMPYNSHASTYMLPNTSSADYFAPSWNARTCYPSFPAGKPPSGDFYAEQAASHNLAQSVYPCMVPRQSTASTDISSLFPTTSPTTTSLSAEGQGTDRTLPIPTGRHQLQNTNASGLAAMAEGVSGLPFSQDFNWGLKSSTPTDNSNNGHTAKPAIPSGTFRPSPLNGARNSPPGTQDMMFDCMPIPSNSASPPSLSSSGTYTTELDQLDSPGDFQHDIDPRYPRATRTFSQDNGLADYSPIYNYSTTEDPKGHGDDAGDSVPKLASGLPYTRVRHSDSQSALPFNFFPSDPLPVYRELMDVNRTQIPFANPGTTF